MSRIGKQIINIPEGTTVSFDKESGNFKASGPKGDLERVFKPEVEISINGSEITLKPLKDDIFSRSLWGTYASHIINILEGVNNAFEKKMTVEGVGYRAELKGKELILNVGFSHPVLVKIPEGIEVNVEKNAISVKGIDKEKVGSFAANVRGAKPPEPYKGKGVRYEGEVVHIKEGKKSA